MAVRATVFEGAQLGVETTSGTEVNADKKLQAVTIQLQPQATFNTFRPIGNKYSTIVVPGREWVQAQISGPATYTELVYWLSSVLDVAAITTPGGAVNARLWTFTPDDDAADAPKTYTVEMGSATRAGLFTYGIVSSFGMEFTRDAINFSGTMIGQRYQDGITLTATPTAIALVPVLPTQVDVYLDDTGAGLGTTQLTNIIRAGWNVGDRFNTFWPLNSSLTSFSEHVEQAPTATFEIVAPADSTAMAILTDMRAGDTKFIRFLATGAEIDAGVNNYTLQVDIAGKVGEPFELSDEDGVFAVRWPFTIVQDATWGKAIEVAVTNELTAL